MARRNNKQKMKNKEEITSYFSVGTIKGIITELENLRDGKEFKITIPKYDFPIYAKLPTHPKQTFEEFAKKFVGKPISAGVRKLVSIKTNDIIEAEITSIKTLSPKNLIDSVKEFMEENSDTFRPQPTLEDPSTWKTAEEVYEDGWDGTLYIHRMDDKRGLRYIMYSDAIPFREGYECGAILKEDKIFALNLPKWRISKN